MPTSVTTKFSDEEYRILDIVTGAAGCTKTEFLRRLFFMWRDKNRILITRPKPGGN